MTKSVKNLQKKKKAIGAAASRVSFLKDVAQIKEQLTSERCTSISYHLMSLPHLFKSCHSRWKQTEAKSVQEVHYTRSWVLNCLLHISSPKAYKLIQKINSLPLPTCHQLNQVISGVPCEHGYNHVVLQTLEAFLQTSVMLEYGTIVLDEIKLGKGVEVNK